MRTLLGVPAWLQRVSARLLLLALAAATLGPVWHGVHEDECEPAFVFHDASQHGVEAPAPLSEDPSSGEHCVACHFARSSRGAVAWEPSGLTALSNGVRLFHADGRLIAASAAGPRPARAPPVHV